MAFPSADSNAIRRCREEHRDLFASEAVRNPGRGVSDYWDAPMQCLSAMQQRIAERHLRQIVSEVEGQATAGMQGEIDIAAEVDSSISVAANEVHLRVKFGIEEEGRGTRSMTEEDAGVAEQNRARGEVMRLCEDLDVRGIDGAAVLELILEGETARAEQLLELTDVSLEELDTLFDSIEAAFGPDFLSEVIEDCRDRLAGPANGETAPTEEIVAELRDRFGVEALTLDHAIDELEDRVRTADERGRDAVLNRLSRGFGVQFDSADEAVNRLRQRIATARGERLRIAPIRARVVADEVRVSIEDGEEFEPFEGLVERRVRRTIDFSTIDPPQTVTVGEVAVRGRGDDVEIERVDLERGIERFGQLEGAAELEPIAPEREQERLEELSKANQRADRIIDLLEA